MIANQVIKFFKNICKIPHPSNHEQRLVKYLNLEFKKMGCITKIDNADNLIVRNFEHKTKNVITLQAHSDMVPVKTPSNHHNFLKDPIIVKQLGGWLKSCNTTLGADDGIGIAMIMSIFADKHFKNIPLEALITSREETGMWGTKGINKNDIYGEYLINIDSEMESDIVIACLGGANVDATIPINWVNAQDNDITYQIDISGLIGGHSGSSIQFHRLNAIKAIGFILNEITDCDLRIAHINGGTLSGSIPINANAIVNISYPNLDRFILKLENAKIKLSKKYPLEKIHLKVTKLPQAKKVMANTKNIINTIINVFDGLRVFNQKLKLPQESSNLGVLKIDNDQIIITIFVRGLILKEIKKTTSMITKTIVDNGGTVNPRWSIVWNPTLKIPTIAKQLQKLAKQHGRTMRMAYSPGGIETKHLARLVPTLKELISIGPNVLNAHSPNEKVEIASINRIHTLLREFILQHFGK